MVECHILSLHSFLFVSPDGTLFITTVTCVIEYSYLSCKRAWLCLQLWLGAAWYFWLIFNAIKTNVPQILLSTTSMLRKFIITGKNRNWYLSKKKESTRKFVSVTTSPVSMVYKFVLTTFIEWKPCLMCIKCTEKKRCHTEPKRVSWA